MERHEATNPARLALVLTLTLASLSCSPDPRPSGAVLIVLDTLRADHVGAYGHTRPTTPNLDRLAARGVLFERAVAYTSWTLPSMVAMLSARYPTQQTYDGTLLTSLVETLAQDGLSTAAIGEGGFVSRFFGLDRGFDFFHEGEGPVKLMRDGEAVGAVGGGGVSSTFGMAKRWLQSHASEPFFLMVHTYEVHAPYNRPHYAAALESGDLGRTFELADQKTIRKGDIVIGDREVAYLSALYDGGVRASDRLVGTLLDALEALDLASSTLVVVTSDHGEELGRRFPRFAGDHGHSLYDELVKVPLIIYDPTGDYALGRVDLQVRNVDILPTILDRLGASVPEGLDGRSLVPVMQGVEKSDRVALFELARSEPPREASGSSAFKLIRDLGRARGDIAGERETPDVELYDLRADPKERTNLATSEAEVRAALASSDTDLAAALEARRAQLEREGRSDFEYRRLGDPRVEDRLRALGYVE